MDEQDLTTATAAIEEVTVMQSRESQSGIMLTISAQLQPKSAQQNLYAGKCAFDIQ